ncbi:MAG: oligosaccharide flippase family protein [Clostridia bacterium]|nr:oligosaccharide flippase family protein [Clostridia bacterium]
MKDKSFSYKVLMLFCSNLLLQMIGLVYRMELSRLVSSEALGMYSLVMQFYGLTVAFCISGLNVALTGAAARTAGARVPSLLFTAMLIFFCLWSAFGVSAVLFSGSVSSAVFGTKELSGTIKLLMVCILLTGTENLIRSALIGCGIIRPCAVSELCEQSARIGAVILLLKNGEGLSNAGSVYLIILAMVMSEFVSVGFLSFTFVKRFGFKKAFRLLETKRIVSVAFPAALTAVSSTLFVSVGAMLLPKGLTEFGMSREEALSIIGDMNTVAAPLTLFPMALVGAEAALLMPEVSRSVHERKDVFPLIKRVIMLIAAVGAGSLILLDLFSSRIFVFFFGKSIDAAVMILLSVKALIVFEQVISAAALNGLMRQKEVLLFAVLGEAFQLLLMLLTVPVLGLYGYIISMITGESLRLVCNLMLISDMRKKGVEFSLQI